MINSVLIFNNDGLPRLLKFYTQVDIQTQQLLLQQIHKLVIQRSNTQCSFLSPPPLLDNENYSDLKIIYRHYATLYFVFVVDEQESELGILDLIQVFVEVLDKCFANVCELDLVFGWQVLETCLEEIVQGGMVIDTNIRNIVNAVDEANKQVNSTTAGSITGANILSNASSASNYVYSNMSNMWNAMSRDSLWHSRR